MKKLTMGLILLNKKPGITSFDALGEIKRSLGTGKVGHTGTLDKFASGLLLVLTGTDLKLTQWFSHCDKQYIGKIHFGVETDTLDPEGSVIAEVPPPSRADVELALSQFTGEVMQSPPAYSAIHVNGKRASELARSGQAPEMKKRPVTIHKIELRNWDPPFAEIFVHCSSGTYIRSLARDIALAADSRAHLCSLARTQIADFRLEDATNEVQGNSSYSPLPITKSVINALRLPWFEITPPEAEKIIHGKPLASIIEGKPLVSPSEPPEQDFSAAVFEGETLIAVINNSEGKWSYGCVFAAVNS
ncbi:MAG: tRNA pseudouridine(55) synthase TruB [Treponema sp.]|jgi:tRNA pseudouridine55 synthase|nr:tRNA pseudouridine(55) synthase TruB [Treponema sp.]